MVDDLRATLSKLESRTAVLEKSQTHVSKVDDPAILNSVILRPSLCTEQIQLSFIICILFYLKAAPVQKPKVEEHNGADEDDDIDLFGSDEEDEEAERIKAERVKEYTQRKAKKPVLIAKSSILLDVKPVRELQHSRSLKCQE